MLQEIQVKFTYHITKKMFAQFHQAVERVSSVDPTSKALDERLRAYQSEGFFETFQLKRRVSPILYAVQNQRVVGFIWIAEWEKESQTCKGLNKIDLNLHEWYLLPDYREKGLGNYLYRIALLEYLAKGDSSIRIVTSNYEVTSYDYKKIGFVKEPFMGVLIKEEVNYFYDVDLDYSWFNEMLTQLSTDGFEFKLSFFK